MLNGYDVANKAAGDFLADGNVLQVLESEIVHSGGGTVAKGDFCYIPTTENGLAGGFWGVARNTPPLTTDFVSVKREGVFVLDVDSQDNLGNADIGFGDHITVNIVTGVLSRDSITATQQVIGIAMNSTTISGDSNLHLVPVLIGSSVGLQATPRGVWQSKVFEMDHADATSTTLITADENPNGLLVLAFVGEVTENIAGSTEDQLIIDLDDEDDNLLSQMTTSATPDVVGDLVQGTLTAFTGATGVALAIIPSGKLAKVSVSQATAGTPAGKVSIRVIVMSLT